MIHRIAMRKRTDVRIQKETLAILQQPIGILQIRLAFANRFHLGPAQGNARLELVEKRVIMAGRPVVRGIAHTRRHRVAVFGLYCRFGLRGNCRIGERSWHGWACVVAALEHRRSPDPWRHGSELPV